jgi:hypothetical protein
LQPDAQDPATMDGQGAESGEAVVEVGIAHGGRILSCAWNGLPEGRGSRWRLLRRF